MIRGLDLQQDLELLKRAEKFQSPFKQDNILLQEKIKALEQECKDQFNFIAEQNEVIKKYRKFVSELNQDKDIVDNDALTTRTIITPKTINSTNTATYANTNAITTMLVEEKRENVIVSNRLRELKDLATASDPKKNKITKKRKRDEPVDVYSKKIHRVNNLINEQKIKFPTPDDHYPEMMTGQVIWNTILRCFRKLPGNIVTEHDIIQEAGICILNDGQQPFLTHEKISNYFKFSFAIKSDDRAIVVREYPLKDEDKSWLVVMPSWWNNNNNSIEN